MNSGLRAVVAGLALLLAVVWLFSLTYARGYDHGRAEGEAALQAARVERAEEKQREAEDSGKALADALTAYEVEVKRVNELAKQMQRERQRHERESRMLEKRIAEVAGGGAYVFGVDFICMLNAAVGVCDASVPATAPSSFSDRGASPCAAFGPGLLESFEGVREADLLAWFIEYAGRCRTMETQLSGWRTVAGEEERQ